MKTIISLLVMLITMSTVWSQEQNFDRKRGFARKKPPRREMHHLRFAKHILSDKCIDEANITPNQSEKLKKNFDLLDEQMLNIGKEIGNLSKKQAEVAVKVLTTPGNDPAEMFKITEEIGKMRTEQAKLSVNVLLVIRDTLQPDQCAKVVKMMKEEREKSHRRMEFMREKMKNRREGAKESGSGRGAFRKGPDSDGPPPPGE